MKINEIIEHLEYMSVTMHIGMKDFGRGRGEYMQSIHTVDMQTIDEVLSMLKKQKKKSKGKHFK